MQPFESIELQVDGAVATVRLARERVRNAFNEAMIGELDTCFERLGRDESIRAVVLAARGPVFCAGADLDWMARMAGFGPEENRRDAMQLARMLRRIHSCPKPTIARVHGDAYAGGIGLLCACDIAVASQAAVFSLSETRLGLIPATIAPYVVRAIGERHALRYFQTAERFDGIEAHRIGLVHALVEPDRLDAQVQQVLDALMLVSPQAAREAKRLVHDVAGRPIDDAMMTDTADRIALARASDDGREGVQAFLLKRKPRWQRSPAHTPDSSHKP